MSGELSVPRRLTDAYVVPANPAPSCIPTPDEARQQPMRGVRRRVWSVGKNLAWGRSGLLILTAGVILRPRPEIIGWVAEGRDPCYLGAGVGFSGGVSHRHSGADR